MTLSTDIQVIQHSDHVEALLEPYRDVIGSDYEGYRGHIYRVLTYTMHFLGGESPHRAAIEAALVYHDLGLWSDKQLAYLEPSIERVEADNVSHGWQYDPQLLRDIIYWHHKVTPFHGSHADVVNAVRKADWIDASAGLVRKGMPKACIDKVTAAIPAAGFYDTLKRLGPELTGSFLGSVRGLLKVYKL